MKINKLNLQTSYLQTLREFYSSILELPLRTINEKEIQIITGSSHLHFVETNEGEPFYHFAFNIPSNKIEEAKAWLNHKIKMLWIEDYKCEIADFVNWHAKSVYFFDPAGNIVELIARFDLENPQKERFSSAQFLSINEVGIVLNENTYEEKTRGLLKSYSLSYFSKQAPLPHFRAIGDDEGLFVVVPENRNWYPTDKPAGIFPMTIEFEFNGRKYELET